MTSWRVFTSARLRGVAFAVLLVVLVGAEACRRHQYYPEFHARGDAQYDAIVARHVLAGDGFTTNLMPLGGLKVLVENGYADSNPWPSAHKFVLAQARIAAVLAVAGETSGALRLASLLPHIIAALLLFVLLRRALSSDLDAFLLALAFGLIQLLFAFAMAGLSLTGDICLLLAWVVAEQRSKSHAAWAATAGILAGCVVLHRYSLVLMLPFMLAVRPIQDWFATRRISRESLKASAIAAGALALVIIPFAAWSLSKFGRIFPSYLGDSLFLHNTPYLPLDPWYTTSWPSLRAVLENDPGVFATKWWTNFKFLFSFWREPFGPHMVVLAGLALYGLRLRIVDRATRGEALTALIGLIAFVFVHLFLNASYAYFMFSVPFAFLLAAWSIRRVARGHARRQTLICACFAVLFVGSEARKTFWEQDYIEASNRAYPCRVDELCGLDEVAAYLGKHAPGNNRIISAGYAPWDLAWRVKHRVLPLLEEPRQLDVFARSGVVVDLILIPTRLDWAGDGKIPPGWIYWRLIRDARPPRFGQYRLEHTFTDGSLLYGRDSSPAAEVDPFVCRDSNIVIADGGDDYLREGFLPKASNPPHEWSWIVGKRGRATFMRCGRFVRKLVLTGMAGSPSNVLTVKINGRTIGTATFPAHTRGPWTTQTIPVNALLDSVNDLELECSRTDKQRLCFALESATFE